MHYKFTFASAYGSCTYGSTQYQNASTTCGSTAGGGGAAAGGGILTNTGFDVLLAATLACAIVLTAFIVRFIKRPAKAPEA